MAEAERRLPGWIRVLRAALGLAVVGFLIRHMIRNWDQVRGAEIAWRIGWGYLVLAVLTILATYAILVEAWRRLVQAWGWRLAPADAGRVWILSSMGKYLPGKLWAVAGLASFAREAGASVWAATASAVVNQLLSIAAGATLAAGLGVGLATSAALRIGTLIALAGGVALLGAMLWPAAVGRVAALLRLPSPLPPRLDRRAVLVAVGCHFIGWLGHGAGLWLVLRGTLPDVALPYGAAVAGFTMSYIAGFLFLLAPGGLGVREGALVLMLQGVIGVGPALALAATSRIALTIADLLAVAPFVLTRRRMGDRN